MELAPLKDQPFLNEGLPFACLPVSWITDLNCDFESKSFCGWQQAKTGDFNWQLQSGTTGSSNTGPLFDHTVGKGMD